MILQRLDVLLILLGTKMCKEVLDHYYRLRRRYGATYGAATIPEGSARDPYNRIRGNTLLTLLTLLTLSKVCSQNLPFWKAEDTLIQRVRLIEIGDSWKIQSLQES